MLFATKRSWWNIITTTQYWSQGVWGEDLKTPEFLAFFLLESGPLLVQPSPLCSVLVCQLVLLWEAAFSFSEFFWKTLSSICPFHVGWLTSVAAHDALSVQQFLTKYSMTSTPILPIHAISPLSDHFFVSSDRKSSQREMFCQCARDKTKNIRSTKRHQKWWVQKLFWAVEKKSW